MLSLAFKSAGSVGVSVDIYISLSSLESEQELSKSHYFIASAQYESSVYCCGLFAEAVYIWHAVVTFSCGKKRSVLAQCQIKRGAGGQGRTVT